jgi:transposase
VHEIAEMRRQGLSIQAIGQLLGYDRKTIRKDLMEPVARPEYGVRPHRPSKLHRFQSYLQERLQAVYGMRESCCGNCASGATGAATRC